MSKNKYKHILKTIALIFSPVFLFSQEDCEEILINNMHTICFGNSFWNKFEYKLTKNEKEKIFRLTFEDPTFNINDRPDSINDPFGFQYLDQYHFIDLDKDNDVDVVFSGFYDIGYTAGNVEIYLNKNGKYIKVDSTSGRVECVEKKDGNMLLVQHDFPCCASLRNTAVKYEFQKDKLSKTCSIEFYGRREINIPFLKPTPLKALGSIQLPKKTILKTCTNEKIPDTVLGDLKNKCQVSYYAQTKDKDGKQWFYVKVDAKNLESKYISTQTIFAWIKI